MEEVIKILIAVGVLLLGIPLGNFLSKITKEELKKNQNMFKIIVGVFLVLGLVGLFIQSDVLMFGCFFIAIVTSGSLKRKRNK
jgi:uncharacterized membrane protein